MSSFRSIKRHFYFRQYQIQSIINLENHPKFMLDQEEVGQEIMSAKEWEKVAEYKVGVV
jgi:coenzyme F420-reducing hydrogenase delta subunit